MNESDLLDAWEQGQSQCPVDRALTLLSAFDHRSAGELADWPIGRRDARLLDLHDQVFGPRLTALADCPACGAKLEFELRTDDLRRSPRADLEAQAIELEGYSCRLRLPTSRDVACATAEAGDNLPAAERCLLARCLSAAQRDGRAIPTDLLPDSVIRALNEALAEADPQADLKLALACPECGTAAQHEFDVLAFLWTELQAWASNLIIEVHTLAEAYGWTEPDVLALSPRRRRLYLEVLRG